MPSAHTAASGTPIAVADTLSPLEMDLFNKFHQINPSITSVEVMSILRGIESSDSAYYAAVAHAQTPNTRDPERYTNIAKAEDIFGVFVLNRKLTRATRNLGTFISPRNGDYRAWVIRAWGDSVVVCGRGEMYGDTPRRWAFAADSAGLVLLGKERDSIARIPGRARDDEAGEEGLPAPDCVPVASK